MVLGLLFHFLLHIVLHEVITPTIHNAVQLSVGSCVCALEHRPPLAKRVNPAFPVAEIIIVTTTSTIEHAQLIYLLRRLHGELPRHLLWLDCDCHGGGQLHY